jgi:hypothetical protein
MVMMHQGLIRTEGDTRTSLPLSVRLGPSTHSRHVYGSQRSHVWEKRENIAEHTAEHDQSGTDP